MTFDINKAAEVEGMTEAEFGVWKSSKYNEVINSIEDKFRIVPIILIADQCSQQRRDVPSRKNHVDPDGGGAHRDRQHPEDRRQCGHLEQGKGSLSSEEDRDLKAAPRAIRVQQEALQLFARKRR